MGALGSGGERWGVLGVLRCGSDRFRDTKGDQHGLRPQELHELPPDLTAWPIAPAHGQKRNRRRGIWRGWRITGYGRRAFRMGDWRSLTGG